MSLLEDSPDHEQHEKEPKPSQATLLVGLGTGDGIELFHDKATQDAFARVPVDKHLEVWPVRSRSFRRWLARAFYEELGKAAGSQALQDALGVLEGTALFEGPARPVEVRIAEHAGAVWLDLGNDAWEAVEVTGAGWRVLASADVPVRFRRPAGLGALPIPVPGGSLDGLRDFANVDDEGWPLVVAFLVAAACPWGPYPVLSLLGTQGSAKTTTARVLRSLLDPNTAGLRSEPRDLRDLAIAARNGHVVGFDNLSEVKPWLSDGLCRLATGGGFGTRELYSDHEEVLFDFQRPVVLTGIEDLAHRGDLVDRSLLVDLPAIADDDRRDERTFWADFEAAQPRMLGALLDAVSTALQRLPEVRLERMPRMADFTRWVVAACPALGLQEAGFLEAYETSRAGADEVAAEYSPVASAVLALGRDVKQWGGTATELLAELNQRAKGSGGVDRRARSWPKTPRALSGALRRVAPTLAKVGVTVEFSRTETERAITLEWVADPASSASVASATTADLQERHDATMTQTQGHDANDDLASGFASSPETASGLREWQPPDAADANDAGTPTHSSNGSNGSRAYACNACGHETTTAAYDLDGFPHADCARRNGRFRRVGA